MFGTVYWLDAIQGAFAIGIIFVIGFVIWSAITRVDLERTKLSDEHYIVKVTAYDDETLKDRSSAQVNCRCGRTFCYVADDFASSVVCETFAIMEFEQHQKEEATSGKR